jgi:ATP-dependent Clp protease ATP-binding subunit ClpC
MFEKYTETARKVVFVARYEASRFGSENVETEHLLLGILRTEGPLVLRLLKGPEKIGSIREQVEKQFPRREKISTSVDFPLSLACKRVLAYGAEEAERLNQKHIAPEHLLLGLLRDEKCVASKILIKAGLSASQLREEAIRLASTSTPVTVPDHGSSSTEGFRDLTEMARNGALSPLIGRERELERTIQILLRRTKSSPVLIGEAGVGKNAIVHGLAQQIADGVVRATLAERRILAIDASSLLSAEGAKFPAITNERNAILYVRGLFDLAGKGDGWGVLEAMHVLEPHLGRSTLQCIATGTPVGFRQTMERAAFLASHFEVVGVLPPTEEETVRIVSGVKEQYEKFHGVVITNEAIEAAVSASRWFLRHRHLPDRAIDLIDEAGARVRLRCESQPRELKQVPQSSVMTPEDIMEAVAARAGVPVSVVKSVQVKELELLEFIAKELSAQIPLGGREWVEGLAAYLAGCSGEEAEKLVQAIRTAKAKLDSK